MVNFVSSSDAEGAGGSRQRPSEKIADSDDPVTALSDLQKLFDSDATTDELAKQDQPLEKSAVAFDNQQERKLRNENEREEQALKLRKIFFWIAVILVMVTMGLSGLLAVWVVIIMEEINTSIIIAFISGLAVESLGLMFIIARYLYPNGNKD